VAVAEVINEARKRPVSLLDHLPPPRLSNAAVQGAPCYVARSAERQAVNRVTAGSRPQSAGPRVMESVTQFVTKPVDFHNTSEKSVTRKRGRPAKHGSDAERQRAYRARKAAET
jgi:hypothetical protein